MSNKKNPKRELAFILYIETDLTQAEIAERVGTSAVSLSKWAIEGDWEHKKAIDTLSSQKLIREYYHMSFSITELIRTEKRVATNTEIDSLSKLAAAIEKIDKKTNPHIVMSVLTGYNKYLVTQDLELAQANADYQLAYVSELLNKKG